MCPIVCGAVWQGCSEKSQVPESILEHLAKTSFTRIFIDLRVLVSSRKADKQVKQSRHWLFPFMIRIICDLDISYVLLSTNSSTNTNFLNSAAVVRSDLFMVMVHIHVCKWHVSSCIHCCTPKMPYMCTNKISARFTITTAPLSVYMTSFLSKSCLVTCLP